MHFAIGVGAMLVVAWIIYGVLSVMGVDNAGNISAYSAMALIVGGGLYLWVKEEQEKVDVKVCPECRFQVPRQASVCGHCKHRFLSAPERRPGPVALNCACISTEFR